jgi:predicted nucleic acid-binding protein
VSALVVDASLTLSWCFPDEQTALSVSVLDRLTNGDRVLVPAFWSVEILNSLLVGERRGRISPEQTRAFLVDLRALEPTLDYASFENVCGSLQTICRDYRLTPYDALYIELALRTDSPLATLDGSQRAAAVALGVQCL